MDSHTRTSCVVCQGDPGLLKHELLLLDWSSETETLHRTVHIGIPYQTFHRVWAHSAVNRDIASFTCSSSISYTSTCPSNLTSPLTLHVTLGTNPHTHSTLTYYSILQHTPHTQTLLTEPTPHSLTVLTVSHTLTHNFTLTDAPPTHRDTPPTYRDAPPNHRDAPPTHRDAPPTHRDASTTYRDAPPTHRDPPPTHRDAPPTHRDAH